MWRQEIVRDMLENLRKRVRYADGTCLAAEMIEPYIRREYPEIAEMLDALRNARRFYFGEADELDKVLNAKKNGVLSEFHPPASISTFEYGLSGSWKEGGSSKRLTLVIDPVGRRGMPAMERHMKENLRRFAEARLRISDEARPEDIPFSGEDAGCFFQSFYYVDRPGVWIANLSAAVTASVRTPDGDRLAVRFLPSLFPPSCEVNGENVASSIAWAKNETGISCFFAGMLDDRKKEEERAESFIGHVGGAARNRSVRTLPRRPLPGIRGRIGKRFA